MFYTFTVKICTHVVLRVYIIIYKLSHAQTQKTDIVWFMHLNTHHRLFSSNTFNECKGFS